MGFDLPLTSSLKMSINVNVTSMPMPIFQNSKSQCQCQFISDSQNQCQCQSPKKSMTMGVSILLLMSGEEPFFNIFKNPCRPLTIPVISLAWSILFEINFSSWPFHLLPIDKSIVVAKRTKVKRLKGFLPV